MALEIISPDGWKRAPGYSHAIKAGGFLHLAGVLPWDPQTQVIDSDDFGDQWATALRNVCELVAAGGGQVSGVVSLRIFVSSMEAYREAGSKLTDGWKSTFGRHFPAITMVEVASLVDDKALLEIEAVAYLGGSE